MGVPSVVGRDRNEAVVAHALAFALLRGAQDPDQTTRHDHAGVAPDVDEDGDVDRVAVLGLPGRREAEVEREDDAERQRTRDEVGS